ncbi:MAG: DNA polymerase III subunit delta [Chitinophagaceae bacterium]|nr:DNA polymerase III subunit delta [Chitinophagaceae bacterium]
MSADIIISSWMKGKYAPVYFLDGEEPYFIDKIINYAETKIINENETAFNLSIFYGRDSNWADIVNACKRYPMFADKQVVIIKEAQHLKEIDKLENYIIHPLPSTILVIAYKDKKLDARTKFAKTIKEKAEIFTSKKLNDNEVINWASKIIEDYNLKISQSALHLLVEHIGNNLVRIANEIEKLSITLRNDKTITEDAIELYIGISKDYNEFELQKVIGRKDFTKAMRIVQYYEKNPTQTPIQLILISLCNYFSKVYALYTIGNNNENTIATTLGIHPFYVKDYIYSTRIYQTQEVEKILLLLNKYALKSVGVDNASSNQAVLLKELTIKIFSN